MELTGQPFVDVGYAIAAELQGKSNVTSLTEEDLSKAVTHLISRLGDPLTDGREKRPLARLGVLPTYWQNNPYSGRNISAITVPEYEGMLTGARDGCVRLPRTCCQTCGCVGAYLDVNRSWFPLGASSGSDPCSLPNLAGKYLCATCFSAVVLLPLGCRFIGGNAYLFHVPDPDLICEAVKRGVTDVESQAMLAKARDNTGIRTVSKLSGKSALLELVSGSRLWDQTQGGTLTRRADRGALVVAFSNAGASPAWHQLHVPAQALDFFAALDRLDLRGEFLKWAPKCDRQYVPAGGGSKKANDLYDRLAEAVEQRGSLGPLLRSVALRRKSPYRTLTQGERKVLEVYEDVALGRRRRFDLVNQLAERIKVMEAVRRDSFLRRLANTKKKETLLRMLCDLAKSDRTQLRISIEELRMLDSERGDEVTALLYLLCIAEG
jgi:hypothetical protein